MKVFTNRHFEARTFRFFLCLEAYFIHISLLFIFLCGLIFVEKYFELFFSIFFENELYICEI